MNSTIARALVPMMGMALTGCTSWDNTGPAPSSSATTGAGGGASAAGTTTTGAGGNTSTSGNGGSGGSGGTVSTTTPWTTPPPDYCSLCAVGVHETVQPPWVTEASGIAASTLHPNTFFIVQDAGNAPEFLALDEHGADMGRFTMEATTNVDMEDLSLVPCDVGTCIYVADIGDNKELRTSYELVKVAEPDVIGAGLTAVVPATHMKYEYGDGLSHNAETLLIHPITGEIGIVTKNSEGGESTIWRGPSPWPPNGIETVTLTGSVSPLNAFEAFSSGGVHPLGHGILLRTLTAVYFFPALGPDAPIAETLSQTPCSLPVPSQSKGEGISWLLSGKGYVANSEGLNGPMDFIDCE